MTSNRSTVPNAAIDVDVDSPGAKRPCPTPTGAQEGTPLTLEMFQSVIQLLITKVGTVKTRIGQVETAFAERTKRQVNWLTTITTTQSQHSADLLNLQQKDTVNQNAIQDIQQRLTKLETHPVFPSRGWLGR